MPDGAKEKRQQIVDDLEDLISQLAQQSDSRATNLQVLIEEQEKRIEERADKREKRRWFWFSSFVTGVVLILIIAFMEAWERHYDRVVLVQEQLIRVQQRQEFFKEQIIKKHEIQSMFLDFHKSISRERERLLNQMEQELREEIEDLHPRK